MGSKRAGRAEAAPLPLRVCEVPHPPLPLRPLSRECWASAPAHSLPPFPARANERIDLPVLLCDGCFRQKCPLSVVIQSAACWPGGGRAARGEGTAWGEPSLGPTPTQCPAGGETWTSHCSQGLSVPICDMKASGGLDVAFKTMGKKDTRSGHLEWRQRVGVPPARPCPSSYGGRATSRGPEASEGHGVKTTGLDGHSSWGSQQQSRRGGRGTPWKAERARLGQSGDTAASEEASGPRDSSSLGTYFLMPECHCLVPCTLPSSQPHGGGTLAPGVHLLLGQAEGWNPSSDTF